MANMTDRTIAPPADLYDSSFYLWGHKGSGPAVDRRISINNVIIGLTDYANFNFFIGRAGALAPDRVSTTLTGTANLFIGHNAGSNITSGGNNTAVGRSALSGITTGGGNTAFGEGALQYGVSVIDCTAVGHKALTNCVSGVGACAFGKNSQEFTQVATSNSSFGDSSMGDNLTGIENSAFGYQALRRNTTGNQNAAFGQAAAFTGTNVSRRAAFGFSALELSVGNGNVGVGHNAGRAHLTGDSNIFIGDGSGNSGSQKTDATNSIAIGQNSFTTANNQTVIGNTGTVEFKAFGAPLFEYDAAVQVFSRVRNASTSASAYAAIGANASGNSFAWRMGSSAANGNRIELVIDAAGSPVVIFSIGPSGTIPDHADDTAAASGGVPVKGLYRTGSTLKIRVA
jgi:hypothetical protein